MYQKALSLPKHRLICSNNKSNNGEPTMKFLKQSSPNGITEGVIWKQLLLFFFPILFGTFFQQLYNTVDAVIVGNFVGKEALAAVGGSTGTLINLLVGFFVGISSGATVIISQYFGAQKREETSNAVHTSIALAIAGGAVLMLVGIFGAPFALQAMGVPEEILPHAIVYIRIYFMAIIPSLIYNIGSGILRAVGDSKRPLYFLIICSMTNLVLDYIFVVWFHMGVAGAGLATAVSQLLSAFLVLRTLVKTDESYHLNIRKIHFTVPILRQIIRIGFPAGLQSVMYSSSNIIIQASVNGFGTIYIAAAAATDKIDGLFWMIIGAFGVSVTTFVGQNFGAQKFERMKKSVWVCLGMASAATVGTSILLYFGGVQVYRFFTDDPQVIQRGVEIMRFLVPFYICYVSIEVFAGALRGAGDALLPMLMTCIGVCVLRIAWVQLVAPNYDNILMIYVSYPITWTVTSLLFIIYYLQGSWLKRRKQQMGFSG